MAMQAFSTGPQRTITALKALGARRGGATGLQLGFPPLGLPHSALLPSLVLRTEGTGWGKDSRVYFLSFIHSISTYSASTCISDAKRTSISTKKNTGEHQDEMKDSQKGFSFSLDALGHALPCMLSTHLTWLPSFAPLFPKTAECPHGPCPSSLRTRNWTKNWPHKLTHSKL